VRAFLGAIGRRAFRRPLEGGEIDRYAGLVAEAVRLGADTWAGLEHAVAGLLQSPKLLYVAERGEPIASAPGLRRYTRHEMAVRLSLALTGLPPDPTAADAADAVDLTAPDAIRAHVKALLARSEIRRASIGSFFAEYFEVARIDALAKDPAFKLPGGFGASLRQELERVLDETIARDEDLGRLLERRETFVNAELARLYEVPFPGGGGFQKVALPAGGERVGALGQGAFLATHAGYRDTSPEARGKFVSQRLLCRPLLPPPAEADEAAQRISRELPEPHTKRMEAEPRLAMPQCAGCHRMMDPIGLSLEGFDAIGRHRTTDRGLPLDLRGEIDGAPFAGLAGLARTLAGHPEVAACFARQLYRFASGARERADGGARAALAAIAAGGGGRLGTVIAEVLAAETFRTFSPER
jgi:hypothetical protein